MYCLSRFKKKKELIKKLKKDKEIYLGDIIVNLDKITNKNNIKIFNKEFNQLWVHGLIHLLGHDHKREKDFIKMNRIEKKYIKIIDDKKNLK